MPEVMLCLIVEFVTVAEALFVTLTSPPPELLNP
jgi:hypothetical protein